MIRVCLVCQSIFYRSEKSISKMLNRKEMDQQKVVQYLFETGRYERATPNQRVALSTVGKMPHTFRAEKSYQDCGLSV